MTIPTKRANKNYEILNCSCDYGSDYNPKKARQESKLGCQYGAEKGAGTGNGGEMVAKEHVFIGGIIIGAIF